MFFLSLFSSLLSFFRYSFLCVCICIFNICEIAESIVFIIDRIDSSFLASISSSFSIAFELDGIFIGLLLKLCPELYQCYLFES